MTWTYHERIRPILRFDRILKCPCARNYVRIFRYGHVRVRVRAAAEDRNDEGEDEWYEYQAHDLGFAGGGILARRGAAVGVIYLRVVGFRA